MGVSDNIEFYETVGRRRSVREFFLFRKQHIELEGGGNYE